MARGALDDYPMTAAVARQAQGRERSDCKQINYPHKWVTVRNSRYSYIRCRRVPLAEVY